MPRNQTLEAFATVDGGEVISTILVKDDVAVDVSSLTITFALYDADATTGTPKVAETSTGVTKHPTKNVTYDSTTGKLKCYAHGIERGDEVVFSNSGGALPTGLTAGQRYFCRDVTEHYFNVCLEPDTTKVTVSAAGSGTHSFYIVGHVQYSPQAGDYDTAGTYYAAFFTDSPHERYPGVKNQNNPQGTTAGMIKVYIA